MYRHHDLQIHFIIFDNNTYPHRTNPFLVPTMSFRVVNQLY